MTSRVPFLGYSPIVDSEAATDSDEATQRIVPAARKSHKRKAPAAPRRGREADDSDDDDDDGHMGGGHCSDHESDMAARLLRVSGALRKAVVDPVLGIDLSDARRAKQQRVPVAPRGTGVTVQFGSASDDDHDAAVAGGNGGGDDMDDTHAGGSGFALAAAKRVRLEQRAAVFYHGA
jgi:hypothetical protein